MSYQSARNRRGFTMIELLIVMGIAGIIVTLAMGRTTRMITAWRVNAAAQAIQNDLQSAFAIVGRNRKPLVVSIDKTTMQTATHEPNGRGHVPTSRTGRELHVQA